MSKRPYISLIILTWNGLELTQDVLENISHVDTKGLRVEAVVVDNDSKDETVKVLKNYKLSNMEYKLLKNSENLGYAGGNNVGIKYALKNGADFVVLMNNDIEVSPDIFKVLLETFEDPKVGAVSPKMYFAPGYEFHKDRYKKDEVGKVFWYAGGIIDRANVYSNHKGVDEVDHGQYDKIEETDFANGALAMFSREVLQKVGILDDRYFLYWEDIDLSERIKRAGYKVIYNPKASLWHKVSSTTGGSGGETNDYFITRNRLLFGMRYSPLRTKFALFRDSIRILFTGRHWQSRGVFDYYIGRLGKGSRIK